MCSNSSGPRAGEMDRLRDAVTLRPDPEGEVEGKKWDKFKNYLLFLKYTLLALYILNSYARTFYSMSQQFSDLLYPLQ